MASPDGPAKEVFFSQTHHPGDLAASDFTHMTSLNVTIAGQLLDHMVYQFVLTYSNWEAVQLCYSESFQSLSDGLQHALSELGGVPLRHRTDRMSAAVNNPSKTRQKDESSEADGRLPAATFTARYQALMNHYSLQMEKTQPRRGKRLSRFDVVMIDDFGYVQQSREEMEVSLRELTERAESSFLPTLFAQLSVGEKMVSGKHAMT